MYRDCIWRNVGISDSYTLNRDWNKHVFNNWICCFNLFTNKAVLSIFFPTCSTRKAVLQPGFNCPKQYKGELRLVCELYLCYFFIYVSDWSVVCIKASAKMLVYGRLSIRCLNWCQMQNDLWSRTGDAQCMCTIIEVINSWRWSPAERICNIPLFN